MSFVIRIQLETVEIGSATMHYGESSRQKPGQLKKMHQKEMKYLDTLPLKLQLNALKDRFVTSSSRKFLHHPFSIVFPVKPTT